MLQKPGLPVPRQRHHCDSDRTVTAQDPTAAPSEPGPSGVARVPWGPGTGRAANSESERPAGGAGERRVLQMGVMIRESR